MSDTTQCSPGGYASTLLLLDLDLFLRVVGVPHILDIIMKSLGTPLECALACSSVIEALGQTVEGDAFRRVLLEWATPLEPCAKLQYISNQFSYYTKPCNKAVGTTHGRCVRMCTNKNPCYHRNHQPETAYVRFYETLAKTPRDLLSSLFFRSQCYLAICVLTGSEPNELKNALRLFLQFAPLPSLSDINIESFVRRGLGSDGSTYALREITNEFTQSLINMCWVGGHPLINLLLSLDANGEFANYKEYHWRKGSLRLNKNALRKAPIEELVDYCCWMILAFKEIVVNINYVMGPKCAKMSWPRFITLMIFEKPFISNEATISQSAIKFLKKSCPRYNGNFLQFLLMYQNVELVGLDKRTYKPKNTNQLCTRIYGLSSEEKEEKEKKVYPSVSDNHARETFKMFLDQEI
jgi:hypothetical protein